MTDLRDPAAPESRRDSAPRASVISRGVVAAGVGAACFATAHTAMFATLPVYVAERGGSETDIALIVGSIGVVSVLTRPLTGWLIDAWGRRAMLLAGITSMAAVSFGYGFASLLAVIGVLRAIQGTAVGIVNTALNTYVSDVAPPGRRAEALGYVSAMQTTAMSLGPTLGYFLITWTALAGFDALAAWWPDLRVGGLGSFNFAALFAFMTGICVVGALVVSLAPELPRQSVRRPGLGGFVHRKAIVPLALLITGTLPFAATLAYLPFFGPERGLGNAGLYFTIQSLGTLTAGLVFGRVADRVGRRPVVVGSYLALGATMLLLANAPNAVVVLLAGFGAGLSQSAARNALAAYTADQAPPQERGAALSTFAMGFDLGIAIGAPILGVAATLAGLSAAFLVAGVLAWIGVVVALRFLRETLPIGGANDARGTP